MSQDVKPLTVKTVSGPRPEGINAAIKNLDLESSATHLFDAKSSINVSRETIESIKRTLYNAINRLDQLIDK